jgi:hypothetical protein
LTLIFTTIITYQRIFKKKSSVERIQTWSCLTDGLTREKKNQRAGKEINSKKDKLG